MAFAAGKENHFVCCESLRRQQSAREENAGETAERTGDVHRVDGVFFEMELLSFTKFSENGKCGFQSRLAGDF
jgi:hypothetical protein